jgi:CHAT domain-containing protein/tetratricopeptide (TPR) repeat protein
MSKHGSLLNTKTSGRLFLGTLLACLSFTLSAGSISAQSTRRQKLPPGKLSALAEKAVAEGDRLRGEWKRDSLVRAAKKYSEAQFFLHVSNYSSLEANVLEKLGDTYAILSDYQAAIDSYNRALQLTRVVPDERLEVDLLTRLSRAYLEMANVKKALPFCSRAQEISRRLGYHEGTARALDCLGVISSISSEVVQAQEQLERALAICQKIKGERDLAHTQLNLGYLHSNLGNTERSLDYYKKALAVWQAMNDRQKQALTLTAMAGVFALQGEKQTALNLHNQALKLFQTIGNSNGEAATLNGIGYVYDDLGARAEALRCYTRALQLYESVNNRPYAAITLGYVARLNFALGQNEKALEFYNQKLATSRALQDRRMEAYTLKDIGNVLSATNEGDKAQEHYRQALVLSQEVMDRRGSAYILVSIGALYDQRGDKSEALSNYEKALSLMRDVADRRGEVLTLYGLASAKRDLGRLAEARHDIEKSLELIETLRTKVSSPSLRISYLETVYKHYEFYIDLLMRMHRQNPDEGYDIQALEVNEHARARALLENLIAARADIRQGVEPGLLAEERELQQRLNQKAEQQTRLLSSKAPPERGAAIRKEVEALLAQYKEVESRVRDKSPKYAALTQPRQLPLADLQKELDSQTLLLEYSLGAGRSYGWVVTEKTVTSFELPGRIEIERVAKALYESLAESSAAKKKETPADQEARMARAIAAYPAAAARLSAILLDPAAPLPAGKRLLVVADGLLQYIPFAALPEPGQAAAKRGDAPPLFVDHEVNTLPSLSTLAVLRNELRGRQFAKKALAVMADPVFERDDPRVKNFRQRGRAKSSVTKRTARSVSALKSQRGAIELATDDDPVVFERLPFSLQEAQAILGIAPKHETMQAVGFDANLQTALDPELRQYRIVHFATHALLNNSYPELSGIVLSLVDSSGHSQNGILRLNEIYNLNLPAELVVLSACQTALGKEVRGEGLIGLTRGFMYAGVPRVVASLWRINDRAAAEFMRVFYEAMFVQHEPPGRALRLAQLKMWQTKEWRFPHYWAAFVLQGEWQ